MENRNLMEEEPKTLQDYLQILLFHKWKIAIVAFIVIFFAAVKLYFSTPVYQAVAVVMIEEEDQMQTMFDFANPMSDKTILNEIEIVKSRHLAERLVEKIWNSPYRDNLYLLGTKEYKSNATDLKKKIKGVIPFVKEEKKTDIEHINVNAIVQNIRENELMTISNRRETNILDISFKSIDSLEAIFLVNQFVESYRDADIDWSSEEISNLNDFLVEQLESSKDELTKAENALQQFQEKETVFGVEEEIKPILEQVTKAETEYTNTVTEIRIATAEKAYLESQLSKKEKELAKKISDAIETKLEALRQELYIKEGEMIRVKKSANKHVAVQDLEAEIAGIRQELEDETNKMINSGLSVANPLEYSQELLEKSLALDAELSGLETKKSELLKVTEQYNDRLSKLPEKQLKYVRLERDRKVLQEGYLYLRTKMEEAKIKKASEGGKIRIIDRAAIAEKISPKKKQDLLLGIILGLGLGVGLVLLIDFMDNTIRTIDDIERTGLTLLGVIPYIGDPQNKKYSKKRNGEKKAKILDKKIDRESSIITHLDPKSPVSEAYRVVRTNINMASFEEEIKTILISSPGPGEGKTTTIANLAITFANLGKRTLVVDCDMRKPRIHAIFGLKNNVGLMQTLVDDKPVDEVVYVSEDIENLHIMASGGIPPNPSELLGSQKMRKLIGELKEKFDIVLFDTPPFTAVTDPVMMAKEVDKNFLVVKAGQTNRHAFHRALQSLEHIESATSGVIINWLSKSTSHDANYYYQNYYRYYND